MSGGLYSTEKNEFDTTLDLTQIKPYGDTMNDGKTQISFTLPVSCGDEMATLMFPYNIVEVHGVEVLKRARAKDIGTISTKPLAGGNLDVYKLSLRFIAVIETCDITTLAIGRSYH